MNKPSTSTKYKQPPYFIDIIDPLAGYLADIIVNIVKDIKFITPNIMTWLSFFLHLLGSVLLFWSIPNHLYYAAFLIPLSYVLDCVDGRLARVRNTPSLLGRYLDMTLDMFKVFSITFSLSLAAYFNTAEVYYLFLGFIAGYFYLMRNYIKYQAILIEISRDDDYLKKSKDKLTQLYENQQERFEELSATFVGKVRLFFWKYRGFVFVDEEQLIVFPMIAALTNQMELCIWILAMVQSFWVVFKFIERACQINNASDKLLLPMRK